MVNKQEKVNNDYFSRKVENHLPIQLMVNNSKNNIDTSWDVKTFDNTRN